MKKEKRPECNKPHSRSAGLVLSGVGLLLGLVGASSPGCAGERERHATAPSEDNGGGYKFVLRGSPMGSEAAREAAATLRRRLEGFETVTGVTIVDERTIRVAVPKNLRADPKVEAAIRAICTPQGVLEFRILADRDPASPTHTRGRKPQLVSELCARFATNGPTAPAGEGYAWFPVEDVLYFMHVEDADELKRVKGLRDRAIVEEYGGRWYVLAHSGPEHGLLQGSEEGRWRIRNAFLDPDPLTGQNTVSFEFDANGGRLFGELTGSHINRQLCVFLDDMAMSIATIMERITSRCRITGRFTPERAQQLCKILGSDPLPLSLEFAGRVD